MAEFTQDKSRVQRYTSTLSAGDLDASFTLPREARSSNITMEFTGGGSVSHTVSDTTVEVRNIVADEGYDNATLESTFTYTLGTSVLITIDVNF